MSRREAMGFMIMGTGGFIIMVGLILSDATSIGRIHYAIGQGLIIALLGYIHMERNNYE